MLDSPHPNEPINKIGEAVHWQRRSRNFTIGPRRCRAALRDIACWGPSGHTLAVKKTTLEFDEELFSRAPGVLGTRGLKATVQRAFEEVVALHARRVVIRQLQTMDELDLDRPEVMAEAWR